MAIVIIEVASRLTFHQVMKPITPNAIEAMFKATTKAHNGWGIKIKEIGIITAKIGRFHKSALLMQSFLRQIKKFFIDNIKKSTNGDI